MRYTRKLNVPTIATLSNLLRNTAVLLEAVSWLIVQPDECSLRFLFLLLEHFVGFCLDGGDGFLAVPIECALQLWMGWELGSVRYVLCLSFSSFRLFFFPWVQECSIRAALWFWILEESAVVTRQQTNSKESYLWISHTEKKLSSSQMSFSHPGEIAPTNETLRPRWWETGAVRALKLCGGGKCWVYWTGSIAVWLW